MSSISMVELRQDAVKILGRVKNGEQLVLTYRGQPVARLSPYRTAEPSIDDPFYRLADHSVDDGASLKNEEMDAIIYGL